MLFPSLGLTFIDHGGKVGIDEHRLDGFQLHRAAVAYASVSDGPSPRLAGAFPWPNERGVAEKSKVGKVKVRGASTLYAPSYSLIVIIVIIHSFIQSRHLSLSRRSSGPNSIDGETKRGRGWMFVGSGDDWFVRCCQATGARNTVVACNRVGEIGTRTDIGA